MKTGTFGAPSKIRLADLVSMVKSQTPSPWQRKEEIARWIGALVEAYSVDEVAWVIRFHRELGEVRVAMEDDP